MPGLEWPHELEISLDGERVFLAEVGGPQDNKLSDTNLALTKETLDKRLRTRLAVKAGPHDVGVTFLRKNSALSDEPLQPFTRNLDLQDMNGVPTINFMQVTGPFDISGSGQTPSRRKIFVCPPLSGDDAGCAKKILTTIAQHAYRRPVDDSEVGDLMRFFESGRKRGSFDTGIEESLAFVLASPKFLFRAEPDPAQVATGATYPVPTSSSPRACRSSSGAAVPDDELLNVAASGKLQEAGGARASGSADAGGSEGRKRWSTTSPRSGCSCAISRASSRTATSSRTSTTTCGRRCARETELFFESIMREDRNVLDLLTADYTFVNERLAQHYGIPGVYGSQFRRVKIADENRRGLLGQGTVLAVTSYPNRTSPVLRGKCILENILGTPPPSPPANVPPLKETGEDGKPASLRDADGAASRERRRARPATASWIRSASRSRTSTPPALARRRKPPARSTRRGSWPTARPSMARSRCARRC